MLARDDDRGSRFLYRLVGSIQASLRRRAAGAAALWTAAAALAALAVILVIDLVAGLPVAVRPLVYLVAGPVAVAAVGAVAGRAWLRKPLAFYVARLIEAERPELKNALVTFVELACDPGADPSMRAAVGRRAAGVLARDGPETFLPPSRLRRPVMAAAGAAAVVGAVLWFSQGVLVPAWVATAAGCLTAPADATAGRTDSPGDAAASASPHTVPSPADLRRALEPVLGPDAAQFERLASALAAENGSAASPGRTPGAGPEGSGAGAQGTGSGGQSSSTGAAGHERGSASAGAARAESPGQPGASGGGRDTASAAGGGNDQPGGPHDSAAETTGAAGRDQTAAGGRESPGASPSQQASAGAGEKSAPGQKSGTGPAQKPAESGASNPVPGGNTETGQSPDTGGGGAAKRPPRAAGDPPLPDRTPSDEFPASALDAMRRARRLIEEADRRLRQGEVSDAFLDRMGVGNAEFRRFVTAWQRKLDAAAPGPAVTAPPAATRTVAPPAPGGILRPDGGPDARPVAGPVAVSPDGRQGWVQGRQSPVSPQLRPAVEAYFEAVDRMAAEGRSGKASQ